MKRVLIWGREGNYGPDYPRATVSCLRRCALRRLPTPDVILVPCFRQRYAMSQRLLRRATRSSAATPAFDAALRQDEEHGLPCCRPGDPDDLARAIGRLAARRGELAKLTVAARRGHGKGYSSRAVQACVAGALRSAGAG